MPNRIKALDYVCASDCPPIRSPPPKPACRRQGAQIEQQVLFQVEERILTKPLAQSPGEPVAYPQRISLKKLAKILWDNESILSHVMAICDYGEWFRPARATVPYLGGGRCGQSWVLIYVYAADPKSVSLSCDLTTTILLRFHPLSLVASACTPLRHSQTRVTPVASRSGSTYVSFRSPATAVLWFPCPV
jgi:hypothetical protein